MGLLLIGGGVGLGVDLGAGSAGYEVGTMDQEFTTEAAAKALAAPPIE
jgi:hypothetical protein